MQDAIALPEKLKPLAGKIMDADAHEMMPAQVWEEVFGAEVRPLVDAWTWRGEGDATDKNHPNAPDYQGDVAPVSEDLAVVKGCRAPGAVDMEQRIKVLDAFGIDRQLMFPTGVGMYGLGLVLKEHDKNYLGTITDDRGKLGRRYVDLYNEWAVAVAKEYPRIVPVTPLCDNDVDALYKRAEGLIKQGVRAVWLPSATPLAGLTPAHPDLDRFWALLAEAGCTPTLHVGAEASFFSSTAWKSAPAFEGYRALSEFDTDPWTLSTKYMPYQNFAATMVNGGVFVRHPELMLGVVETTACWVGAMMRILDMWYDNLSVYVNHPSKLAEKPSYYIRNNIRVTAFPFEDIRFYIEQEDLADVICFATDYPHVEGGKDMFNVMLNKMDGMDFDIIEKFFATNGAALFGK